MRQKFDYSEAARRIAEVLCSKAYLAWLAEVEETRKLMEGDRWGEDTPMGKAYKVTVHTSPDGTKYHTREEIKND